VTNHLYPIKVLLHYYILCVRRVWRYQRSNQNPYIDKQTTQLPTEKVQKNKQRSTKHTHKLKIEYHVPNNNRGRTQVLWKGIQFLKFAIRLFKQSLYTVSEVWGTVFQTIIIYCEWSLRYGCSNNRYILWVKFEIRLLKQSFVLFHRPIVSVLLTLMSTRALFNTPTHRHSNDDWKSWNIVLNILRCTENFHYILFAVVLLKFQLQKCWCMFKPFHKSR
jgi:hypothetical protein